MSDYQVCPYCGAQIRKKSTVCTSCGSDERTGWSDQTYLDGIDIDFEEQYEDIKSEEFSKKSPVISWQTVTGAGLLIVMIVILLIKNL